MSVYTVQFQRGRSALETSLRQRLRLVVQEIATDCLLNAQVVGHVAATEIPDDALPDAHRLARSRADVVQAFLVGAGIPTQTIASIWDWQFMVREARATLWVFELKEDQDCKGLPLGSGATELLAQGRPTEAKVALRPDGRATPAPAEPTSAPIASQSASSSPSLADTTTAVPSEVQVLLAMSAAERPRDAESHSGLVEQPELTGEAPEIADTDMVEAGAQASKQEPGATGSDVRIRIIFPTNSTFFLPDSDERLRGVLRDLPEGGTYEVVLESSVSGSKNVVGAKNAEEAERYHQWLATERLQRVERWLHENANGRALTINLRYRPDDDSRQVLVRIRPAD